MFKKEGQHNIKDIAVEHRTKQLDFFHMLPEIARKQLLHHGEYASWPNSSASRKLFVWVSLLGIRPTLASDAKSYLKDIIVKHLDDANSLDGVQWYLYLVSTARQAGIENTASPGKRLREEMTLRLNEMATREDGRGLASLLFLAKIAFPGEIFITDDYRNHIRDEIVHARLHTVALGSSGWQRLRELLAHCRLVDPSIMPNLSDAEKAAVCHYDLTSHVRLVDGDVEQLAYARLLAADDASADIEGVHIHDHAATAVPQTRGVPSARRI